MNLPSSLNYMKPTISSTNKKVSTVKSKIQDEIKDAKVKIVEDMIKNRKNTYNPNRRVVSPKWKTFLSQ